MVIFHSYVSLPEDVPLISSYQFCFGDVFQFLENLLPWSIWYRYPAPRPYHPGTPRLGMMTCLWFLVGFTTLPPFFNIIIRAIPRFLSTSEPAWLSGSFQGWKRRICTTRLRANNLTWIFGTTTHGHLDPMFRAWAAWAWRLKMVEWVVSGGPFWKKRCSKVGQRLRKIRLIPMLNLERRKLQGPLYWNSHKFHHQMLTPHTIPPSQSWIMEKSRRKSPILLGKTRFSCRFSWKSIDSSYAQVPYFPELRGNLGEITIKRETPWKNTTYYYFFCFLSFFSFP